MSKKQESVEEIVGSLQSVGEDISQIGKLVLEEKALVKQFFDTLKSMQLLEGSIVVSTSALPVGLRRSGVAQACVDSTALLMLTFIDGHREIRDLNQTEDFDLTASVACDIAPKFEGLVVEMVKKIRSQPAFEEHPKVQDPTAPALKPELPVFVAPPVAEEAPPITLEKALTSPPTAEPPPEHQHLLRLLCHWSTARRLRLLQRRLWVTSRSWAPKCLSICL